MRVTLACGAAGAALRGAIPVSAAPGAVSRWRDGTVDCILARGGLDTAVDPIRTLRAWRRVLKEGGALVLGRAGRARGGAPGLSRSFLLSLVQAVGGFEPVRRSSPTAEPTRPLVLIRRRAAEVRAPLAALGPALTAAEGSAAAGRGGLLFQVGAMLLQSGEPALARACFDRVLLLAPASAEGHLGQGMAHACALRWQEALGELLLAYHLAPDHPEVRRWLAWARRQARDPEQAARAAP